MSITAKLANKLKQNKVICMLWCVCSKFTLVNEPELRLIKQFVCKGAVCFDIGANIGSYTYAISSAAGRYGKVFAFEPLPENLRILTFIIKFLRLKNTSLIPGAVSNKSGEMLINVPFIDGVQRNTRAHLTSSGDVNSVKVKVTTIADIVSKYNLHRVDFIKCDVEGAEKFVFEGGENFIKLNAPVIVCELGAGSENFGLNDNEVFSYIKSLCDYKAYVYTDRLLKQVANYQEEYINYVFMKKQGTCL